MAAELQTQPCPTCGHRIDYDPVFSVWCPACEWNLDPEPPKPKGIIRARVDKAADKLARRLYEQVRAQPPGQRGGRGLAFITALLAAYVHLVTLATAAAAVLMVYPGFGLIVPVRVIGALYLGSVALYVQPFRRKRGRERTVVTRAEAPALFGLIDEVAARIHAPSVDTVVLTPSFNASYFKLSRRRPAIALGLSLWSILQPQERVALLGHELGHRINGDLRRSAFVGGAVTTLRHWRQVLEPTRSSGVRTTNGMVRAAELLAPIVLIPLALLTESFGNGLRLVAYRQGQRSEYYADELSAMAGGTRAAVGLLEKLLLRDSCVRLVVHTRRHRSDVEAWQAVREFAESVPEIEWQRRSRLALRRLLRIDTSHPPTRLRADLLRARPPRTPGIVLDAERAAAIDTELAPFRQAVAQNMR